MSLLRRSSYLGVIVSVALVACTGLDSRSRAPAGGGISQGEAVKIAKSLFEKELAGLLPFFVISTEPEPRGNHWAVLFRGTGQYSGPDSLQIILVDRDNGKPFLASP
jgi:hypothetical protein